MEEEKTLIEKANAGYEIAKLFEGLNEKEKEKIFKKLKLPRKAKVSKLKRKKGWIGILFVNPNKVISGQKAKLENGTYRTKDDYIRVTNGSEIAWWDGKYPFIWQRYDKLNPTNLFPKEGDKDEMYGQDLVKLRYKKDLIQEKKKGGMSILWIIIILVGGYFLIKSLFPGLFGG